MIKHADQKILSYFDRQFASAMKTTMGKPGEKIYRAFRAILLFIVVKVIGTLLSFLATPITYSIDRYAERRVNEVRKHLKKVITRQLVVEIARTSLEKMNE